jgi:hypothetical protein
LWPLALQLVLASSCTWVLDKTATGEPPTVPPPPTMVPPCDPLQCPGARCSNDTGCLHYISCLELHQGTPSAPSGRYEIDPDGPSGAPPLLTYCELSDDGGGWTLAMKIDGSRQTFAYTSPLWANLDTLNPTAVDMDREEAKLDTFRSLPFSEVRLGLAPIGATAGPTRWLVLNLAGPSLHALFTGTAAVTTSAPRTAWSALLPNADLQPLCGRQGVNVGPDQPFGNGYARARLGIVGNGQDQCIDVDSAIGVGLDNAVCTPPVGTTLAAAGNFCCNQATCTGPGGQTNAPSFAYVMVR